MIELSPSGAVVFHRDVVEHVTAFYKKYPKTRTFITAQWELVLQDVNDTEEMVIGADDWLPEFYDTNYEDDNGRSTDV